MAELGFPHHHAGKKGAQRKRDAEQFGGTVGNADRCGHHGQGEQLTGAGVRHLPQQPGQYPAPSHQHQGNERADLQQGLSNSDPERFDIGQRHDVGVRCRPQHAGQGGQQNEHQHTCQVLDHKPADGNAAIHRLQHAACFKGFEQHYRTGTGERKTEDQAGTPTPTPPVGSEHAQRRCQPHLHDGTRHRDALYRQQVAQREMQADAEHQQHHPDFGKLGGDMDVRHEAGRRRTNQDAGEQVADQSGHLDPLGDEAEDQRHAEAGGNRGYQGEVVLHRCPWIGCGPCKCATR